MKPGRILRSVFIATLIAATTGIVPARAQVKAIEATQKTAELQIRNLLEPLLDKYCHEECKLLGVDVQVDVATPQEVAPGFDDVEARSDMELAATSAKVKLLIDEKVGPISRGKLLELIQQYLDTLDYPVRVDTELAHFPQPVGSAAKIAELRESIEKKFRGTLDELFGQFCPDQCLLADFDLKTEATNPEEAQYGASGEYMEDDGVAVRVQDISATILVDETLPPDVRANILEMAKLKTNYFKNVTLTERSMRFPHPARNADGTLVRGPAALLDATGLPGSSSKQKLESTSQNLTQSSSSATTQQKTESKTDQKTTAQTKTQNTSQNVESNNREEHYERFEKIERVENGDAVQKELQKFKVYGLVFACAVISLLIFLALSNFRSRSSGGSTVHRIIQSLTSDPIGPALGASGGAAAVVTPQEERNALIVKRYEIERLRDELMSIFAQHPKVAKYVFTRVLTEEGVETTSAYIHIFGESVVMEMLRDPSLQSDMNELTEFHAKNPMELTDDDKLELLRKLHNRTVAGKLVVMASRSSNLFDFLAEMDGTQILELIRNESLTVKSIVLTQCDPQKRAAIYGQLDQDTRMKLMAELSRIDYLPRDFIFNVATALKRKRKENPKLNTEALPGSDVLLTLLERTGREMQKTVIHNLELSSPESARSIKNKLVSLDTLRFLRDGQLLEVVLNLKHDELLTFLKGVAPDIRAAIYAKSPKDLVADLDEELATAPTPSREGYQAVERKVLNRMKLMANEGLINLVETNDRMLAETGATGYVEAGAGNQAKPDNVVSLKKVGGW